jgi:hypothetical protein
MQFSCSVVYRSSGFRLNFTRPKNSSSMVICYGGPPERIPIGGYDAKAGGCPVLRRDRRRFPISRSERLAHIFMVIEMGHSSPMSTFASISGERPDQITVIMEY